MIPYGWGGKEGRYSAEVELPILPGGRYYRYYREVDTTGRWILPGGRYYREVALPILPGGGVTNTYRDVE